MYTLCTPEQLQFQALGKREVIARFDGGRITSDASGVLLRETDIRLGLTARLARCFRDYRNPGSVEHPVRSLVAQRVYATPQAPTGLSLQSINKLALMRLDPGSCIRVSTAFFSIQPSVVFTAR